MSNNLERLGNRMSISIPPDEDRFTGRECPVKECEGYFKIENGTGLTGENLPCHCPYCGNSDSPDKFFTKEQLEYATSVAINETTGAFLRDLKELEFEIKPRGMFGIGVSLKVSGNPEPIHYYREKNLETEIVCDRCTLRYAIYGVFAFCPDCGAHNSLQILQKNLDLCLKELDWATQLDRVQSDRLIGDALENAVSSFDGFGLETCRIAAIASGSLAKIDRLSFQNLSVARERVKSIFDFDFGKTVSEREWELACRCFQKRHLLAHKMGVVDDAYMNSTNDPFSQVGRKVSISADEVKALIQALRELGVCSFNILPAPPEKSGE